MDKLTSRYNGKSYGMPLEVLAGGELNFISNIQKPIGLNAIQLASLLIIQFTNTASSFKRCWIGVCA